MKFSGGAAGHWNSEFGWSWEEEVGRWGRRLTTSRTRGVGATGGRWERSPGDGIGCREGLARSGDRG